MNSKALNILNLPTPDRESWKYTNLPKAMPQGLKPVKSEEQFIHRHSGQNGGEAVNIVWNGWDGALQTPVLKVVLEEGAQLTLIEYQEGEGVYWKNMTTEIELGPNTRLDHIRIQQDGPEAVHTNMAHLTLEKDAVYNGFSLNLGGKMTRHELHAVLNGTNAECSFNGLNLLKGSQHGDTTILIEHKAPHGRSNQFYRTVLDDSARCVFQGKVHVHKPAQKTDGYQLSNAIMLSEKAEMDTKPELEIYADDVKCSHGATTGQLDEEPLFYLRTRGLSEAEAKFLLMEAFVSEVADKIGCESARTEIHAKSMDWLRQCLK